MKDEKMAETMVLLPAHPLVEFKDVQKQRTIDEEQHCRGKRRMQRCSSVIPKNRIYTG
jgi:hypothetical protein